MIDHVSVAVGDLAASSAAYERVLGCLGLAALVREARRTGFGKTYPEMWLNHRPGLQPAAEDCGHHVCLRGPDEAAILAFHAAALAAGWRDGGAPGLRRATVTNYFGAFVRDPDGNRLEAVTFARPSDVASDKRP